MNHSGLLLGVVAWLTATSYLPAQTDAAARSPAAPAKSTVVRDVAPEEAETLLKNSTNVVVLDIRTPREFSAGHLAGATNVNFYGADFAAALDKLDKAKVYLVHCATGARSARAMAEFKRLEFQTIYHLNQGLAGWQKAGKPVIK